MTDFATRKKNIAEAAIERTMHEMYWQGDLEGGFGLPLAGIHVPPPSAGDTGELEFDVRGQKVTYYPWRDWYQPWYQRMDELFDSWDPMPDGTTYDTPIEGMQSAVYRLTASASAGRGEGQSVSCNTDLQTSIGQIYRWLSPDVPGAYSGATVIAFDDAYGGDRMWSVVKNQCEGMITLGLALAGTRKIWVNAKADLERIMDDSVEAFKDSGGDDDLTILTSLLGLAGVFATGGFATAISAAIASATLLDSVIPKDQGEKYDTNLRGGDAEEVYQNLQEELTKLNQNIYDKENEVRQMIVDMDDIAGASGRRNDFHINPESGLAPDVQNAGPLSTNSEVFKRLGYMEMPQIAAELGHSAQSAQGAYDSSAWTRPPSLGYSSIGAFQAWSDLYDILFSVVTSTANEIVVAGQKLAAAAGFVEDTDGQAAAALKGVEQLVGKAPLGWEIQDSTPPPPTRPGPRGGPTPF